MRLGELGKILHGVDGRFAEGLGSLAGRRPSRRRGLEAALFCSASETHVTARSAGACHRRYWWRACRCDCGFLRHCQYFLCSRVIKSTLSIPPGMVSSLDVCTYCEEAIFYAFGGKLTSAKRFCVACLSEKMRVNQARRHSTRKICCARSLMSRTVTKLFAVQALIVQVKVAALAPSVCSSAQHFATFATAHQVHNAKQWHRLLLHQQLNLVAC